MSPMNRRSGRRWRSSRVCALLSACTVGLLSSAPLRAAPTPPVSLLILSKDEQQLAIVDPRTLAVVARVPAGPDPHEVAVSSDGRTAYVSNYAYGRYHTLTVIDLVAQRRTRTVDVHPFDGPHGLATAGSRVWFTSEIAKSLARYDPATRRIDVVIGVGQDRSHMLWVSPDEQRVIAVNVNSGTLSVFDRQAAQTLDGPPSPNSAAGGGGGDVPPWTAPHEGWRTTLVRVGPGCEGFAVSPDGRSLWVANANEGTISVVDLATLTVTHTLQTGLALANRVAFTPDGRHVLVTQFFGPDVAVFDAASGAMVKKIPAGRGSAGIVVDADGRRAFVSLWRDNAVAIVDLSTLTVTGRIDAGRQPDGLALAHRR